MISVMPPILVPRNQSHNQDHSAVSQMTTEPLEEFHRPENKTAPSDDNCKYIPLNYIQCVKC